MIEDYEDEEGNKGFIIDTIPKVNYDYINRLGKLANSLPKTDQEKIDTISLIREILNETEATIPFEEKMVYLQHFCQYLWRTQSKFPKQ